MKYQSTTLPNGLTVVTAQMPSMASVSVGLWVGVGGRYEPAPVNGICHFIEHLLFKGTKKRSAEEISQAVEGVGGYLNAFTGEESTCFYARAQHDRFGELFDVLADMFLNSTFAPAEIAKERDVIKEEIAMYLDQPQQHVQELLNQTQWPDHPLGRPLTGTPQTLDAMRRHMLMDFKRRHYVSEAIVVAAAGNVDHRRVCHEVRRFARACPAGRRPGYAPLSIRQQRPVVRLATKDTAQTQLALGIRTCSRHDERRYALRVLNTILGENMSSRLFQVVREDHGLAYSIHSGMSGFDDTGDLVICAGLETENLTRVLRLIARELKRLTARPPGRAELRRARDYLLGQMDLSLESTENQMMWLGEQWLGYGRIIPPDEIKKRLAKVTAADVRDVAREFFLPQSLNLALVSPLKTARHLSETLGK